MALAKDLGPKDPERKAPADEPSADVFVSNLMLELAAGDIRLPSFPDIAARVQQVLGDPGAAPARVALVVGSDAALAARVLRLANSAFLNPSAMPIKDLQLALTRLGHQLVRCTAVSFALQQMNLGSGDAELRPQLQKLWREGALVAAIAYVLARETRAANPDEALMTGLMHNIGQLYITVRSPHRGGSGGSGENWADVIREEHPRIAGLILKHWEFPAAMVAAVGAQNYRNRGAVGDDALTNILIAATALVPCVFERALLVDTVAAVPPFQRLGLGPADCERLLSVSAQQIKSLRAALTG